MGPAICGWTAWWNEWPRPRLDGNLRCIDLLLDVENTQKVATFNKAAKASEDPRTKLRTFWSACRASIYEVGCLVWMWTDLHSYRIIKFSKHEEGQHPQRIPHVAHFMPNTEEPVPEAQRAQCHCRHRSPLLPGHRDRNWSLIWAVKAEFQRHPQQFKPFASFQCFAVARETENIWMALVAAFSCPPSRGDLTPLFFFSIDYFQGAVGNPKQDPWLVLGMHPTSCFADLSTRDRALHDQGFTLCGKTSDTKVTQGYKRRCDETLSIVISL